ncbi:MAG TPA: sulfurtransferase TusA family protein [Egibacteraceae bacterium]|nr:sulfurtransferase TusA family protein [Egibacteraceae bacterium]
MASPPAMLPDRRRARRPGMTVARALGSSTRAEIFDRLREAGAALTVRDIAGDFELHPNVARTHLETLADAGLVVVGRRKHPGGGRPAKVYLAREEAIEQIEEDATPHSGRGSSALLVRLLLTLVDGAAGSPASSAARVHDLAAAEARRLVAALPGRADGDGLEAAAQTALRALRPFAPEARITKSGQDWVDIAGIDRALRPLHEARGDLAVALERGLLAGALAAAGSPAALTEAGEAPGGGLVWRARAVAAPSVRAALSPTATIDARGEQRETGVVHAMRAVTRLRSGEVLEVLAEGPGSPAAFARWADRAGHELLGVERATDGAGRPAIRLLIRKGA